MPWSMMPLPTVVATLKWKMKRAAKLKNAAMRTAWWGFSTRVETTVAIELAASWNPFMKSNASATTIRTTTTHRLMLRTSIARLRVFQHDAFDDVRHVLAAVGDLLEQVVDRAQLDELLHVGLVAKQL